MLQETEKIAPEKNWEHSYQVADIQRLWPAAPTLDKLNLDQWREDGIRIVLDAGCGDGKNMAYLAQQGFSVVGLDVSVSALRSCARYLMDRQLSDRCVLLAPSGIETIPAMDGTFSAAICIDVLGHIQYPYSLLQELARVIKPGGFLYTSVFHPGDECRVGPRMRTGSTTGEYWYQPSVPDIACPNREYYYRFYTEQEAQELFTAAPFDIIALQTQRWAEEGHPGFREEPHTHESWFALLARK